MYKHIALFFTLAIFTLGSLSAVYADEGPDGNSRKGKYTYRKVIKACHERGEVDSASPQVSPADKKRAEWKEIFENKNFSAFGCLPEWDALSDDDIMDIYAYFYATAADSPTPATCN